MEMDNKTGSIEHRRAVGLTLSPMKSLIPAVLLGLLMTGVSGSSVSGSLEPTTTTVYVYSTVTKTASVLAVGGEIQRYIISMDNGNGLTYTMTTELVTASQLIPIATITSELCPTLTVTVSATPSGKIQPVMLAAQKFLNEEQEQMKAFNELLKGAAPFVDGAVGKLIEENDDVKVVGN